MNPHHETISCIFYCFLKEEARKTIRYPFIITSAWKTVSNDDVRDEKRLFSENKSKGEMPGVTSIELVERCANVNIVIIF